MYSSPIIRVSRKRTANPHTALVVNAKRCKNDQLLFSLFKTSDAPSISEDAHSSPVIDFQLEQQQESSENDNNPLAFANDSINEIGGPELKPNVDDDVIILNGRPLMPTSQKTDDVVYDFYKVVRGEAENLDDDYRDWQMRIATKEEAMLVSENNDSSDDGADDDDDSNDENNWRNDYPDEEEDTDEDPDDTESDREQWNGDHDGSTDEDDGLRLRIQRFGVSAGDSSDHEDLDY